MKVSVYKFVSWEVPELQKHQGSFAYEMMEKINNGERLTREEKNRLAERLMPYKGTIHQGGYCFDFRQSVRYFIIKQYGQWSEYYAPDKTSLRKAIYGRIDRIVEAS